MVKFCSSESATVRGVAISRSVSSLVRALLALCLVTGMILWISLVVIKSPAQAWAETTVMALSPADMPQPPKVESPSVVVMDAVSGEVLMEKNARERRAPASLTKIMTLVLALEAIAEGRAKLSDEAVTSENAWEMGGTEVWAEPGEAMTLDEWLKAIAVGSANDASVVVAEFLAGDEGAFVSLMNEKAKALGMTDTNFKNAHGLDEEGHYTTAMDMAILSRHAVGVPHLLDYTRIYQQEFRGGRNLLTNFNKLVYLYDGCDGLKTGYTAKSGYCIVATAQREGSRFIVVVMGAASADQRTNETWKLLDWAFANFRSVKLASRGETVCSARVLRGTKDEVPLITPGDVGVTILRREKGEVSRKIRVSPLTAPVGKGDFAGEMDIFVDGKHALTVKLLAGDSVPKASFLHHFLRYLRVLVTGK